MATSASTSATAVKKKISTWMIMCMVAVVAAVGGVAVLAGLGIVPNPVSAAANPASTTDPSAPPTPACTSTVEYYAFEAPAGTNRFGPEQHFDNVDQAAQRFQAKLCTDPLFAAGVKEFLAHGTDFDQTAAQNDANAFVADHGAWLSAIQQIGTSISGFTLVDEATAYSTLGMIRGPTAQDMPTYTKFGVSPNLGQALVATLPDGSTRYFRILCDFQFSAPQDFTKITPDTPSPSNPDNPACQPGQTGTYPNCVTPTCAEGQTGTYPNCVTPTCESAYGSGYTGTYPVCKGPSTEDPAAQGNASTGGGQNADPGPGTYTAPSDTTKPPSTPYVAPPAPVAAAPADPAPPVDSTPDPVPPPAQETTAPAPPATGCVNVPGMPKTC